MKRIITSALILSTLMSAACSNSGTDSSSSKATTKVKLNTVNPVTSLATGGSGASGLLSLKYLIGSISICEDLTPNGSGFSNTMNCAALYSGQYFPEFMNNTNNGWDQLKSVQDGNYADHQIDLMDSTSRAKLNVNGAASAGTYKYAIITWSQPIQFKAQVTVGGTTIYSKPATSVGTPTTQTFTTSDMTVGPAEDAVILSPNGGTYFKFPTPFVITEEDVEAKKEFVVDLVFNSFDVIRATDTASDFSMTSFLKSSVNGAMYMPMLSLSPVPRLSTDTNTKEVYTISDGTKNYRLELYYNTADTDKKIYGASLVEKTGFMGDDAKIASIEEVSGKLDFTSVNTSGPGTGPGGLIQGFVRGSSCSADNVMGVAVTSCTQNSVGVVN